jgi:S-adenosylmethionine-diacylgycerolhomoserine-N-methlytransferase
MNGDGVAAATVAMDRMYQRQRHIYDFTRKYYLLGRDRAIEQLQPGPYDSVLETGCGTARNLILAAHRYPDVKFFGADVSTAMLTSAHEAIARAGLSTRVRVAHGDATSLDPNVLFGKAKFERIFMSYSLSMIPRWRAVVEHAMSMLAQGGQMQIVDFGGQEGLPAWLRAGLRHWLTQFDVTPRDELERALMACLHGRDATVIMQRPYKGYAQHAIVTLRSSETGASVGL